MGEQTRFGGGRHVGTGHLVHSARIGPAVVVVHAGADQAWAEDVAADLNEDGFTVLIPDLFSSSEDGLAMLDRGVAVPLLHEAITHMRMNWHPRVGLVSFDAPALATAVADDSGCDAVVVFSEAAPDGDVTTPMLWRSGVDAASWGEALEFLHHHLA